MGAADRTGPAARQDAAEGIAADDPGDFLAAPDWRHQNGAKWRSIPAELGPWRLAAQLFIRWAKQGIWGCLLDLVQQHDIALGISFIDGTNIRVRHEAAGAKKEG